MLLGAGLSNGAEQVAVDSAKRRRWRLPARPINLLTVTTADSSDNLRSLIREVAIYPIPKHLIHRTPPLAQQLKSPRHLVAELILRMGNEKTRYPPRMHSVDGPGAALNATSFAAGRRVIAPRCDLPGLVASGNWAGGSWDTYRPSYVVASPKTPLVIVVMARS